MLPRKLIYVYFVGTVFAIGWIYYNFGNGCQESGDEFELEKKKVQIFQQKHESQKSEIEVLKRRVDEYKSELRKAEIRLSHLKNENSGLPKIFLITPTYARPQQKAELTRLSHTLRLVPNIHWIVVEDSAAKTVLVSKFLANCKVSYTHLNKATPGQLKLKENDPNWLKPRGVHQRNAGLDWIRKQPFNFGVVYFADDDNTYDLQLFEEITLTSDFRKQFLLVQDAIHKKSFSMASRTCGIPLVRIPSSETRKGMTLNSESPVVKQGKVIGWYTYWKPERQFAMDMAGFAVNLKLFKDFLTAQFHDSAGRGNLESDLLTQLHVTLDDLEPKADQCTKVLVWHTRTEKPSLKNEEKMMRKNGFNSENVLEV